MAGTAATNLVCEVLGSDGFTYAHETDVFYDAGPRRGFRHVTFGVKSASAFDVAVDSSDRTVAVSFAADQDPDIYGEADGAFAAARLR